MAIPREEVCVLIPTLNEAPTIGEIVSNFRTRGFPHVLVMDGHSRDMTREFASSSGADVRVQSGRGKGNALIEAFQIINQPYILMLDGDGTYLPEDADQMLEVLDEGYDQVIGNRLVPSNSDSFSRLNLFGNNVLNRLFRFAHTQYLCDILSGYRAFRSSSLRQMHLKETGFEIETEISAESVRCGQKIAVIPISYRKRPGSKTKLDPFHDGLKIMSTIYRLARTNNPLFYFGMIGIFVMIAGFITGAYVLGEWFRHVEHLPLTVLTVLLIVVGFQVFMFGIISDMLLAYHRELILEIQQLRRPRRPGE
jgi:glycosyltransferase (TIGR04182 family)